MTTPAIINFGSSWGTPNGQDLSMPSYMASGLRVVAEAYLRRLTTGRGELIDDPNYGFNVMDLVSDDLSPSQIAYAQQQIAQEGEKDERILRAAAVVALTVAGLLNIAIAATTAAGPFKLVLAVSAVSVSLLLVQS